MKESKNYIGYVRVSTKTQVYGHGLDVQKQAIIDYCKNNNINLVKIYADEGISAVAERPAFKKAMKRLLEDDNIDGLITYDLTRFGRSIVEIHTNINQIREAGKELVIVKHNIVIRKEMDSVMKAMLGFFAVFAEFERDIIRERMQAGKERAKIQGTRSGKPMHRPKANIDWNKVRELRRQGLSWSKIAHHVGVTPATLINRAKEEGYFDKFNKEYEEYLEKLISRR